MSSRESSRRVKCIPCNFPRGAVASMQLSPTRYALIGGLIPTPDQFESSTSQRRGNPIVGTPSRRVQTDWETVSEAILKSASAQLRNLATIGGNPLQKTRCGYFRAEEGLPCNKRTPGSGCSALHGINDKHAIFGWSEACVATQPSDPATALAALDAVYVTEHRDGGRRIKAEEFHTLPGDTPQIDNTLRDGELIVGIELVGAAPQSAYLKLRERESYEYAVVSAAVALDLEGDRIIRARIALGSVAHKPWRLAETERALAGVAVSNTSAIGNAIDVSFAAAKPLEHNAYKVQLAKNATARTIRLAVAKAPS